MSLIRSIRSGLVKYNRYLLGKKYMRIFAGVLKGYWWSTSVNYDYLTGTYEDPAVIDKFCSWMKPGTVFYDLGAHVGYYSILAAQTLTTGEVHSFEPVPANRELFMNHLRLNASLFNSDCIHLHALAVTAGDTEVEFTTDTGTEGNTYIKNSARFAAARSRMVMPAISVDQFVRAGNKAPAIMKIDVEGAELEVLKGALETIKDYRPFIMLATHDCHVPGIKDQCLQLLHSLDYVTRHTGYFNKGKAGLDDYIAIPGSTDVK